jgi:hypothetical protein
MLPITQVYRFSKPNALPRPSLLLRSLASASSRRGRAGAAGLAQRGHRLDHHGAGTRLERNFGRRLFSGSGHSHVWRPGRGGPGVKTPGPLRRSLPHGAPHTPGLMVRTLPWKSSWPRFPLRHVLLGRASRQGLRKSTVEAPKVFRAWAITFVSPPVFCRRRVGSKPSRGQVRAVMATQSRTPTTGNGTSRTLLGVPPAHFLPKLSSATSTAAGHHSGRSGTPPSERSPESGR